MRTVSALNTANINLTGFVERSIAPMVMVALDKLMQERLQKLDAPDPIKPDQKVQKAKKKNLDLLFLYRGY